jgi:hypothetical protein
MQSRASPCTCYQASPCTVAHSNLWEQRQCLSSVHAAKARLTTMRGAGTGTMLYVRHAAGQQSFLSAPPIIAPSCPIMPRVTATACIISHVEYTATLQAAAHVTMLSVPCASSKAGMQRQVRHSAWGVGSTSKLPASLCDTGCIFRPFNNHAMRVCVCVCLCLHAKEASVPVAPCAALRSSQAHNCGVGLCTGTHQYRGWRACGG